MLEVHRGDILGVVVDSSKQHSQGHCGPAIHNKLALLNFQILQPYTPKLETLIDCDIIRPSSQDLTGDIC